MFKNNGHQLPSDVASYPRRIEISTVITCSKFFEAYTLFGYDPALPGNWFSTFQGMWCLENFRN